VLSKSCDGLKRHACANACKLWIKCELAISEYPKRGTMRIVLQGAGARFSSALLRSPNISKMLNKISCLVLACVALTAARPGTLSQRDEVPTMPYDLDTTSYCTFWYDNDGSIPCAEMPDVWYTTLASFRRWVSSMCNK
jgi:hypothetical protein